MNAYKETSSLEYISIPIFSCRLDTPWHELREKLCPNPSLFPDLDKTAFKFYKKKPIVTRTDVLASHVCDLLYFLKVS